MSEVTKIILTAIISALVSGAITYTVTIKRKIKAVANGILSCLRADLIAYHDKYKKKGYCPIYGKDAVEKAYKAYHDLGGNGTMTDVYEEIMALPTEPKSGNSEP